MVSPKHDRVGGNNGGNGGRVKNPIKQLLGFGCFVQGFRGFPWLAVNFFLKDWFNVDPSTLQLLQTSANLPMVAKPLYGVVSDAVYIGGQHRIPYIAIGALLQALSWLAIAILSRSNISLLVMSLYLLLSNLGASISEVANDAIVAEAGKQSTASSGELQSFVWVASSVGGVLGNLLGGFAIQNFSPNSVLLVFGVLAAFQFLITITIREKSLNLPGKNRSTTGIKKQMSELAQALKKREIAYTIGWLGLSTAVIPALGGTMFFYQTQHLSMEASLLGFSKVFGQFAMLLWGVVYNKWLKPVRPRKLIVSIQVLMAVFMCSDYLFVKGVYREMGVPDSLYVIFFSGLLEVLFFFKFLPFSVLIAQLCPEGCEGSLTSFVTSAISLAFMVSGYLGIVLASYVGVTGQDFSGFPLGILVQAGCTLFPIIWSSWIYDGPKDKLKKKE